MATAAAFDRTIERGVSAHVPVRLSRVAILDRFEDAETPWRELESPAHLSTAFQAYDFVAPWHRHVGTPLRAKPLVAIAYDRSEQAVALLPLVLNRSRGGTIASFPGGKHATFNMPLWRRDFAERASAEVITELMRLIAEAAPVIDAFAFTRQPAHWDGVPNPMLLLPHQAAVNECPMLHLEPGAPPTDRISHSFRRRLKRKERKLQSNSGFRYTIAQTPSEAQRLLDVFFATKPQRLAAQGLPNVFAEAGTETFVRETAAIGFGSDHPLMEIHALECDDEVMAMFAGVAGQNRLSVMFNTYTMSANAKYSPGLILIRNIIDHCAAKGRKTLDLGVGADAYKLLFCKERKPLFDSFLPATARGRLMTFWLSAESRVKRSIKRSASAMTAINRLRRATLTDASK